jgi:hypothetical protein
VPRATRTRRVSAAQARIYLGKAEEFLVAARDTLEAGHSLAATSLAVHAGISAGDAICGARTGQRAAGSDHGQVVALLNQAGRGHGRGAGAHSLDAAQEPRRIRARGRPEGDGATHAVEHAERIVQIARQVVT